MIFDPGYAEAFKLATAAGVEALAYRCRLTPEEIAVDKAVRSCARYGRHLASNAPPAYDFVMALPARNCNETAARTYF